MDFSFLPDTPIFQGFNAEDLALLLGSLAPIERTYQSGEVIFRLGEPTAYMGLVLSGAVSIESDDLYGAKSVLDHVFKGQVFGETYAFLPGEPMMVSAVALEKSRILLLRAEQLFAPTMSPQLQNAKRTLEKNLLSVFAKKSLILSRRMFHMAPKTIRDKLMSYLNHQRLRSGSNSFVIPFNRQQLADYLGVDRSALSNEIGKLSREGVLTSRRNHFALLTR